LSTNPEHKLIFALMVIIIVLLIVLAGYLNYKNVAQEENATIMADKNVGFQSKLAK
jgi:hypothetical protein